ncbi:MAG TPA: hypothetical protein ENF73_04980 [Proteobacteria bacterium]|nr:hypothetical protein [Pseudomonadota bacterium]
MKKLLVEVVVIVLLASTFGVARNLLFPNSISLAPSDEPILDIGAKQIDLEQAKRMFEEGVVFLDARGCPYYTAGHIAGARCLKPSEYEEKKADVLAGVAKDQPLVTYCDGKECSSSVLLAEKLLEDGYTNVYVYPNGWNEWREAGLPIEKGIMGGGW